MNDNDDDEGHETRVILMLAFVVQIYIQFSLSWFLESVANIVKDEVEFIEFSFSHSHNAPKVDKAQLWNECQVVDFFMFS